MTTREFDQATDCIICGDRDAPRPYGVYRVCARCDDRDRDDRHARAMADGVVTSDGDVVTTMIRAIGSAVGR